MNRAVLVMAVLTVVGGALVAYFGLAAGGRKPSSRRAEVAEPAVAKGARGDWHAVIAGAGLPAGSAILPDAANAALKGAAKAAGSAKALARLLADKVASGALVAEPEDRVRRHPIRAAAELYDELAAGKARPVHSLEVAWLSAAMLSALGLPYEFVTAGQGLATPALLSRTEVAVRSAGTLVAPLGPIASPKVVPAAIAASWWLVRQAYVARGRRRYKTAHALLAAAAMLDPQGAAAPFARGLVELDQGLINRGVERCSTALAKVDDPLARLFLAEVLHQLQRPFKAWQQVEAALSKHPDLAQARASKGILEAARVATLPQKDRAAKLRQAEKSLRRALELDPAVPGARAGLARVLMLQNRPEEAEKLLVEAIDAYHDAAAATLLAGIWATTDKAEQLIVKLEPLAAGGDVRVIAALVQGYIAAGRTEDGLRVAEKARKASADDPTLGVLYAQLLAQTDHKQQAVDVLAELRAKGDDDRQLGLLQAQLQLNLGKAAEAIAILEPMARGPEPRDPTVLLLMAYKAAGRDKAAEALGDRAIEKGTLTRMEVAGMMVESDDAAGAERILTAAIDKGGASPEEAGMLAMLYTADGRREQAEKMRDKLVAAAGGRAAEYRKAIDGAIKGAAATLEQMKKEEDAAGSTKGGAGSGKGGSGRGGSGRDGAGRDGADKGGSGRDGAGKGGAGRGGAGKGGAGKGGGESSE